MEKLSHKKFRFQIQSMRSAIIRARVQMCRKLISDIKKLSKRKTNDVLHNEKSSRKISRLKDEVLTLRHLKPHLISEFALSHTEESAGILREDPDVTSEIRALAKVSLHKLIKPAVQEFHKKYPKWRETIPKLIDKEAKEVAEKETKSRENMENKSNENIKTSLINNSNDTETASNMDSDVDISEAEIERNEGQDISGLNKIIKSSINLTDEQEEKLTVNTSQLNISSRSKKSKADNSKSPRTIFPRKYLSTKFKKGTFKVKRRSIESPGAHAVKVSDIKRPVTGLLANKWEEVNISDNRSKHEDKTNDQNNRMTLPANEILQIAEAKEERNIISSPGTKSKNKDILKVIEKKESDSNRVDLEVSPKSTKIFSFSSQKNRLLSNLFKEDKSSSSLNKDTPNENYIKNSSKNNVRGDANNSFKKKEVKENEDTLYTKEHIAQQNEDPFFLTKDNQKYMTLGKIVDESKVGILPSSNKTFNKSSKREDDQKYFSSIRKGDREWKDTHRFGKRKYNASVKSEENIQLHPSWEAKKKTSIILPFQGKKICFDD